MSQCREVRTLRPLVFPPLNLGRLVEIPAAFFLARPFGGVGPPLREGV